MIFNTRIFGQTISKPKRRHLTFCMWFSKGNITLIWVGEVSQVYPDSNLTKSIRARFGECKETLVVFFFFDWSIYQENDHVSFPLLNLAN